MLLAGRKLFVQIAKLKEDASTSEEKAERLEATDKALWGDAAVADLSTHRKQ